MCLCAFNWLSFDKKGSSLATVLGEFMLCGLIFKRLKLSVLDLERV